ncbi:DUF7919 family protein [Phytomonospora endophytica]|uniref:DUF7919 domain-containing protein n=1 Tax=Phytomonospora endophytica TaxID=714109 RepID=A0A841G7E5_9ACTN|nr:hypothetical protein [Phytomonospora endophytica]MBB6039990.1 hypothetical protein [Phytomonospora endophytica]GIG71539.1 hypothetical protein Pen01_78340 [Phytomonospora endophytica]
MTHFEDLTVYDYLEPEQRDPRSRKPMLNVGWLDPAHDHPMADADPALVEALCVLVVDVQHLMRGVHACEFCPKPVVPVLSNPHDPTGSTMLGNGEIHVVGNGMRFAAPTMVIHYISEHYYRPPDEFTAAALRHAARLA